MANTRKLELKFGTDEGGSMTLTYNYVAEEIAPAKIKTLMDSIITNGSIFKNTPITKKTATIVVVNREEIEIPE